jgi:hypothetical protein
MAMNVLHELGLCIGRTRDENGARVRDRFGDRLKESVILRRMPAADAVRLVVDMSGWMLGVENQLVDIRRANMKDARFMMIDPDHGMKMLAHKTPPGRFGAPAKQAAITGNLTARAHGRSCGRARHICMAEAE